MKQLLQPRVLVACVIFVTGVTVAWRALDRRRGVEAPIAIPQFPYERDDFEAVPTEATLREVAGEVSARVARVSGSSAAGLPMPPQQSEALAERAASKLASMLGDDSSDRWRDESLRDGATGFRSAEEMTGPAAEIASQHQDWASRWRLAPLSVERTAVRRLDATTDRMVMPDGVRVASALRNVLRARFPPPPQDAELYEVVIPALVRRNAGSRPDVPVYLGIAYWWNGQENRWVGAHGYVTVYIPHGEPDVVPPR